MNRFQFKFNSVLTVRKAQESNALTALAASQRAYQVEVDKKERLKMELDRSLQARESLGAHPVEISLFHSEQSFITGTKHRLLLADQAIFRASKAVEKTLRGYLQAKRQTRMIETLYDRAYLSYRRERKKQEAKQNDDLVLMRMRLKEEDL